MNNKLLRFFDSLAFKVFYYCVPPLGIFHFYCQLMVLAGADFNLLLYGLVAPFMVLFVFFWKFSPPQRIDSYTPVIAIPSLNRRELISIYILLSVESCLFLVFDWGYISWIFLLLIITAFFYIGKKGEVKIAPYKLCFLDGFLPYISVIVALFFVIFLERTNMDDAIYMSYIASTLNHPDLPLLSFDGLHGLTQYPSNSYYSQLQIYELIVAIISKISGITYSFIYLTIFPAVFVLVWAFTIWHILKDWGGNTIASRGLFILTVLLITWGGGACLWGMVLHEVVSR